MSQADSVFLQSSGQCALMILGRRSNPTTYDLVASQPALNIRYAVLAAGLTKGFNRIRGVQASLPMAGHLPSLYGSDFEEEPR